MKVITKDQLSRIGFINKTHGYKGTLHCVIEVSKPEKLLDLEFLFISINNLPVPFLIEEIEVNTSDLFVKLEDIDSDTKGKTFQGKEIYAEKFRQNKKTHIISWKDVKGYKAVDLEFGEIGIIEEVLEFPMQFIAKCMVNEKEVLIPLNDFTVTEIDETEKIVHLELPDGLLDIYLS